MAGRKTLATREVNGRQVRYVLTQAVGEYEVKVISDSIKGDPATEAVYEVSSKDGKVIPGAVVTYLKPNFWVGDVMTGQHYRAFSDAVYAAVEAASAKPRRPCPRPRGSGRPRIATP